MPLCVIFLVVALGITICILNVLQSVMSEFCNYIQCKNSSTRDFISYFGDLPLMSCISLLGENPVIRCSYFFL